MKKYFLLIFFLFFTNLLFAEERYIKGTVTDDRGSVVSFCVISLKGQSSGVYGGEDGNFIFNVTGNEKDTLVFSCLGYETKELAINGLNSPLSITLKRKSVDLGEVTIRAFPPGKQRTGMLFQKTRHQGNTFLGPGYELGLYFKPDNQSEAWLKEVYVYISPFGIPDTKFRIHVYAVDSVHQLPGQDITDSNLIVHASPQGREWVKVDLSSKRISVDNGIYITIEWISGYGNNNAVQEFQSARGKRTVNVRGKRGHRVRKSTREHATNQPQIRFKGQVLGMTRNRYGKVCFQRQVLKGTSWISSPDPLIPMIYATYVYY